MTQITPKEFQRITTLLRIEYLRIIYGSREALTPSVFSIIDIISYLYINQLILHDTNVKNLIISKGHAASVVYPFLVRRGLVDFSKISYGKEGSPFGIYPNTDIPFILMPSGSLGHGLGVAAGMSESTKENNSSIFIFLGDGECTEGSIWEAAQYVGAKKLKNIVVIIDGNNRSILGDLDMTYPNLKTLDLFRACGFDTQSIDGHSYVDIKKSFQYIKENTDKGPFAIYAKTIKGKGIDFMEASHLWHNKMPTNEELDYAISQLLASLKDE